MSVFFSATAAAAATSSSTRSSLSLQLRQETQGFRVDAIRSHSSIVSGSRMLFVSGQIQRLRTPEASEKKFKGYGDVAVSLLTDLL